MENTKRVQILHVVYTRIGNNRRTNPTENVNVFGIEGIQ